MKSLCRILSLIFIIFISISNTKGQEYAVSNIPSELQKDVFAVIRNNDFKVTVESRNKFIFEKIYAITVFNEKGEDYTRFTNYYNSSEKFTTLEAYFFDKNGKRTEKYKKNDFKDYSAVSGFELFNDLKVKTLKPTGTSYPYTVEFRMVKENNDFLMLPVWFPVVSEQVSVQSSSYHLFIPEGYEIKIREYNIEKPLIKSDEKGTSYSWEINNLKGLEIEPFSPKLETFLPKLLIIPQEFEYDGYAGSFKSWSDFGLWEVDLNKGRDELPPEAVEKVKSLVSASDDKVEKVKILYDYLQKNTRYVNVSFGIGGYQPLKAEEVYKYGYGDCKALSNYMKAMLKVAGIESIYTNVLAGRGKNDIDVTFPYQQFNHIILCVPVKKDTLWLECTSQTNPFNYIGRFTDDRHVLLIKESGGELAKTKAYPLEKNLQSRKAKINFETGGKVLKADVTTSYEGLQFDMAGQLALQSGKEQKEYLLKNTDISDFIINDFSVERKMISDEPVATIDMDLSLRNYFTESGDRIIMPLNLMNKNSYIPKKIKERKTEVQLTYSYIDTDSIEYVIPDGYEIQFVPEDVEMKYPFAEYYSSATVNDNKITYSRKLLMRKGTYPKESYDDLVNFFFEVTKADGAKAMLMKSGITDTAN